MTGGKHTGSLRIARPSAVVASAALEVTTQMKRRSGVVGRAASGGDGGAGAPGRGDGQSRRVDRPGSVPNFDGWGLTAGGPGAHEGAIAERMGSGRGACGALIGACALGERAAIEKRKMWMWRTGGKRQPPLTTGDGGGGAARRDGMSRQEGRHRSARPRKTPQRARPNSLVVSHPRGCAARLLLVVLCTARWRSGVLCAPVFLLACPSTHPHACLPASGSGCPGSPVRRRPLCGSSGPPAVPRLFRIECAPWGRHSGSVSRHSSLSLSLSGRCPPGETPGRGSTNGLSLDLSLDPTRWSHPELLLEQSCERQLGGGSHVASISKLLASQTLPFGARLPCCV